MNSGGKCWYCGTELSYLEYGRQDTCRKCGKDTHACRGCVFHDKSFNNECKESQADRVVDKEKSNFCDYFKPNNVGTSQQVSSKDTLRAAAEALFKKK